MPLFFDNGFNGLNGYFFNNELKRITRIMSDFKPICMTEEYWANSQFSMARYYGCIIVNGHEYVIVNKDGKDIFQCSKEADKAGREKAIEPGEPADLCRKDFVTYYRRLGREKFLEVLNFYPHADDKELKQHMKNLVAEKEITPIEL